MKKILSVLLSVIMIVSCLSMVVFVVNAGGTENKVNDAVLLTATGQGSSYIVSNAGIFDADTSFTGTKTVKLVIKNVASVYTAYDLRIQGSATGGWVDPTGVVLTNNSKSIAPGAVQSAKIEIPVENGMVSFNGGTETRAMETLFFRFNTTVAGKLVITAIEDESHNANAILSTWSGTGSNSTAAPASTSDYKITELINPDAEGTDLSNAWSTGNSGTTTMVIEGNENVAAQYTPDNSQYGSIAYDITPVVLNSEVNPFTDGAMLGTYQVKFRAKAEEGNSGKFTVCFVSNTWSDRLFGANKYSITGTNITMTDEWQTYTATVQVNQDFIDVVKHNTDCRINLRLDGSGSSRAYNNGNNLFGYYIDDVEVYYAEAIKVTQTTEGTAYRTNRNYTEAQVDNGFIHAKYYVYNTNDYDVKVRLYHQKVWDDLTNVDSSAIAKTLTIPAKSKMLFDFDLPVTGEAGSYKVGDAPISDLAMRIQLDAGFMPVGSTIFIENASENVDLNKFAVNYMTPLGALNNAVEGISLKALPDYPLVTPTPVPTATATPNYVGVKLVAKAASTSQIYAVTRDAGVFKADATFTGTKSVTYTVYNTSDEKVHVNIVLSALVDGGWYAQNNGKSAEFAPGEKVDITATIDVTNGTATIKNTEVPLDKILLRVNVSFKEDGADIGDSVIIATNGSDDALYGVLQTGFNVEYVTELPTVTVVTPTPVPTATATATATTTATATATATATPTPTPTPIPNKVVSNGDAENGDTNWSSIHAGSVQITADPDDANNKVAYFTPTEGNQYSSVAFDLGPAIIKNAAEGYNGGGAGTYIITFRARAEEGFDGTFSVLLNSKAHKNKGAVVKVNGDDVTLGANTYATGESITMSDEWEEFTATVVVTEEMIEAIEAVKNSSDGAATKAYIIAFRLDGSGSRAFGSEQFCYYVDDIAIEKEGGDEEEPEKTPTGIEYTAKSDIESNCLYFVGKKGAFSMADVKDGELTVKFQVKNSGEEAMGIKFELQALVGGKWVAPANGELVTIDPGKTEWVEYTCEVSDDGKVEISGEDVAISELFIRFDLADGDGGAEVLEGTKFIVYASGAQYDALKAVTARPGWGSANVYSAPAETGDVVPYVLIAMILLSATGLVILNKKREEN